VRCGDVEVSAGDVVFGDDDGLVIAAPERIAAALETAEAIARAERAMLTAMAEGRALHDLTNYAEHAERLDAGEDSRLEFRVD
jgi:4-hydroxy-4-methyl-2-oxoglutarate aldolase